MCDTMLYACVVEPYVDAMHAEYPTRNQRTKKQIVMLLSVVTVLSFVLHLCSWGLFVVTVAALYAGAIYLVTNRTAIVLKVARHKANRFRLYKRHAITTLLKSSAGANTADDVDDEVAQWAADVLQAAAEGEGGGNKEEGRLQRHVREMKDRVRERARAQEEQAQRKAQRQEERLEKQEERLDHQLVKAVRKMF
eukprot:TRINITY_DN2040_c0_g1_i2.p3 TRINITY_DN2040_c0_g1~~TRINITY_DN2040_c0_g1_i2.p3  ORF type:complete len:194 (-),score=78.08 TRINITY_DN2040_c0_g1_i2:72-653(-)